jgi:prevent-host-death family protein
MKTVGVRELKNRLSEYIRRVRAGEGVLVTGRGEVVAELTPPGHAADPSVPAGLLMLAPASRGVSASASSPRGMPSWLLHPKAMPCAACAVGGVRLRGATRSVR